MLVSSLGSTSAIHPQESSYVMNRLKGKTVPDFWLALQGLTAVNSASVPYAERTSTALGGKGSKKRLTKDNAHAVLKTAKTGSANSLARTLVEGVKQKAYKGPTMFGNPKFREVCEAHISNEKNGQKFHAPGDAPVEYWQYLVKVHEVWVKQFPDTDFSEFSVPASLLPADDDDAVELSPGEADLITNLLV